MHIGSVHLRTACCFETNTMHQCDQDRTLCVCKIQKQNASACASNYKTKFLRCTFIENQPETTTLFIGQRKDNSYLNAPTESNYNVQIAAIYEFNLQTNASVLSVYVCVLCQKSSIFVSIVIYSLAIIIPLARTCKTLCK